MSKKFYILSGPPGSGKTTWANAYAKENPGTVVVNRDSIRYELGEGVYNHEHEPEVTEREKVLVGNAMKEGKTVISDNTNLNPNFLKELHDLAKVYGYEVIKKEFYVPCLEAIKRCKKRAEEGGHSVSRRVILEFYKRYYKDQLEKEMTDYRVTNMVRLNPTLSFCVICDLDGTLAMHTGRTPYEWDRIHEDAMDGRLAGILECMRVNGFKVIFLTGRPESAREATETWLNKHFEGEYTLIMREESNFAKGDVAKKAAYEKYIKDKYNVIGVFEDSDKCVEMWRKEGLLTLQVQNCEY